MSNKAGTFEKMKNWWDMAGNAVGLNMLFLLSCIPIVTIGPAWCALYSGIRYNIRGDKWFDGFKDGFRNGFWRMLIAWILCLALDLYMALNVITIAFYQVEGFLPHLIFNCIFLLVALMITAALIPLNVYIPSTVVQWLKNAITMVFAAPLQVIAVALMMWIPLVIVVAFVMDAMLFLIIFVAIYFVAAGLVSTLLLKDVLVKIKRENEELNAQEEEKSADPD